MHNFRTIPSASKSIVNLFTPTASPPTSERATPARTSHKSRAGSRFVLDYIAVPLFPPDLSKVDYTKPNARKRFVKKPAGKVITVKKPFIKQMNVHHHQSLVDALNHAASHNSLPYSRKGKERAMDLDAESDLDHDDEPIIHISRPLKRKKKFLDADAISSISTGPRLKRQRDGKLTKYASSSSTYLPSASISDFEVNQRASKRVKNAAFSSSSYMPSNTHNGSILDLDDANSTSIGPQTKQTLQVINTSTNVLASSSCEPSDMLSDSLPRTQPKPRRRPSRDATNSLPKIFQRTRRVPRDAGLPKCLIHPAESFELEAYPRACYVSLRHLRTAFTETSGREKLWAARYDIGDESMFTRPAPIPLQGSLHSPPKARRKSDPAPESRSLAINGFTSPMQSAYVFTHVPKSDKEPHLFGTSKDISSAATSSNIDAFPSAPMDLDYGGTSADAEGETDLEYFEQHIRRPRGEDGAAPGTYAGPSMALAFSSTISSNQQPAVPYTLLATLHPASSSSRCSSEELVHNSPSDDITISGSQTYSQELYPGLGIITASLPIQEYDNPSWLNEDLRYVENGTIDPTLLGDSAQALHCPTPSSSPALMSLEEINSIEEPYNSPNSLMYQDSPQPPSPVHSPKRTRRTVIPKDMIPTNSVIPDSESDSSVDSGLDLKYPTSDRDSYMMTSAGPSFNPNHGSSSSSISTSTVASIDESRPHPEPVNVTSRPQKKYESGPASFCHQCRHKNTRPKMQCGGKKTNKLGAPCRLIFCDYCIANRYSRLQFDSSKKDFECPKCANYCNCTACTSRRGEVYVSSRTAQVTSDTKQPEKSQHSSRKTVTFPPAPLNPTRYWGTIYNSVTGEKISAAYVGTDDEDPQVVIPRLDEAVRGVLKLRKRVFVGKVQPIWRAGGQRGKYVERMDKTKSGRVYIGNKPPKRPAVRVDDDYEENDSFNEARESSPISDAESELTPPPDSDPPPRHWLEPQEGEFLSYGFSPQKSQHSGIDEETTKKALEALVARLCTPSSMS